MKGWKIIESPAGNAETNMKLDEELFRLHETGVIGSTLRIYTWACPCITYGYSQDLSKDFYIESIPSASEVMARRPTGGGIVFHSPGDFTYCLVTSLNNPSLPKGLEASVAYFHEIVAKALEALGVKAYVAKHRLKQTKQRDRLEKLCFNSPTRYELVDEAGNKIAGSAQRRGKNTLIQQGTIPFTNNIDHWLTYFKNGTNNTLKHLSSTNITRNEQNAEELRSGLVKHLKLLFGKDQASS